MSPHDIHPPEDFSDIEARLSASRADMSEIELDRIKQGVMARTSRPSRRSRTAPRRLLTVLAAGALVIGGSGVVLAAAGGNGGGGDAGKKQYCPPTSGNPGGPKPPPGNCGHPGKGKGHGHDR